MRHKFGFRSEVTPKGHRGEETNLGPISEEYQEETELINRLSDREVPKKKDKSKGDPLDCLLEDRKKTKTWSLLTEFERGAEGVLKNGVKDAALIPFRAAIGPQEGFRSIKPRQTSTATSSAKRRPKESFERTKEGVPTSGIDSAV